MIKCDGFIQAMNSSCKMMDAAVTVDGITYSAENLLSVNPYYEGSLLCSIMKCCDIEIQFDEEIDSSAATALKGKSVSSVKIGAKEEKDSEYSYIEFGEYKVYSAEYREESNSVFLTCYDSMLDSMVPYNIELTASLTVKNYLQQVCSVLGWQLADVSFANENIVLDIDSVNSYLPQVISETDEETQAEESTYTFRDVLDDIAELIGGNLLFKSDNILYPVYPSPAVTDEEIIKLSVDNQQSLSFENQFGPVNSVAIVNSETSDAVVLNDSESIDADGECQITIKDNLLMKTNRTAFINGIFNKLHGLYYTPFEFTSFGYGYMEFGDIFNLEDKKGNLKRAIMLNDNFLLSLTIQETASAKIYSADSETQYSVSTPLDKVIVEVKRLQNTSTNLSERIAAAIKSISKTTDGHAVCVDLEYDEETQRYYVGDGEADTFIVSENPAVATESEPEDWNTGRVIRINYNGIAVSTEGIGGPYSNFAVYYDETLNKYLVNADDIAAGTLQGIKAILDEGIIGGLNIGTWKDNGGNIHEGLKKTYNINGNYITFAIDGTDGSANAHYLLQMFQSDENGNAIASEYLFALSTSSAMELKTLAVDEIFYNGDIGWIPLSFSGYFESYTSTDTVKYRKVGNIVEIRGACKPTQSISGSLTEYVIGNIGSSFAPSSTVRILCQGSGTTCWLLIVKANGDLTFSRYRQGGTYASASTSTWLPVHVTYLLG